jgi:archaellin
MYISSSHYMATGRRTGQIVVAALLIAAGCGGSDDSQPPLVLTEANAPAVAAEALITAGQTTSGVQGPLGGLSLAATSPLPGAGRRAVQHLAAGATGAQVAAPGTMTEACAAGGSTTTVSSSTSATVTFSNCQEDASTRINGTLTLTIKTSSGSTSSDLSFSVSVNLTITAGALSFAESGGYDLSLKSSTDPNASGTELQLTGSHLSVSLSGGAASDKLTLSNFDIDVKQDLSNTPNQQIETIDYDIDSTRLKGHISVMTNDPVKQILDAGIPREFAHAGQVLITGANHTRLQITILGDETFTPPAGQGQVKIELDTGAGSFGAPIWVNWTALKAMVGTAP